MKRSRDDATIDDTTTTENQKKKVCLDCMGYTVQYETKSYMMESVKICGHTLKHASNEIRNDQNVVMCAVGQDGSSLQFASKFLQNDKAIVLEAVSRDGDSLRYASDRLKGDKEVVMRAVKQNGNSLQYASKRLKIDKEVVSGAIENCCNSFEHVGYELQNDKEFAMEVVKKDGDMLKYVSESLQNDKDIVMTAFDGWDVIKRKLFDEHNTSRWGLGFTPHPSEEEFNMYRPYYHLIEFVSNELRDDKDIMLKALNQGCENDWIGQKLRNDKEFLLGAFKHNPCAIRFLNPMLMADKDFVFDLVALDGYAVVLMDVTLKNDKGFVLELLKRQFGASDRKSVFKYLLNSTLMSDKDFIFNVVALDDDECRSIDHIDKKLKNDKSFMVELLKRQRQCSTSKITSMFNKIPADVMAAIKKDAGVVGDLIK